MMKAELLKLAEPGVRLRLREIQLELNHFAKLWPHLIQNGDGSVPAVVAIQRKPGKRAGKHAARAAGQRQLWARLTPKQRAAKIAKMAKGRAAKRAAAAKIARNYA